MCVGLACVCVFLVLSGLEGVVCWVLVWWVAVVLWPGWVCVGSGGGFLLGVRGGCVCACVFPVCVWARCVRGCGLCECGCAVCACVCAVCVCVCCVRACAPCGCMCEVWVCARAVSVGATRRRE